MMDLDGLISVEIFKTKGYKDPRHHEQVYFKIFNCFEMVRTAIIWETQCSYCIFFGSVRTAIIWELSHALNFDGLPDEIVWNEFKTRKELKEVTAGLKYYAIVKCLEPHDGKVTTWAVYVTVDEQS